ncbi:MAG: hypothetical protein ACYC8T_09430 [Myxococcaceae bacterium]
MPFAYYDELSERDQAVYRQSEAVRAIRLPEPRRLRPLVQAVKEALTLEDREATEAAAQALCSAVVHARDVGRVRVEVLDARPRGRLAELHGLYTPGDGEPPCIRVWMRTAQRGKVVAFRTFVRTLAHELVHHFDATWLGLRRSFHTAGFYGREASLFHQLVPEARAVRH